MTSLSLRACLLRIWIINRLLALSMYISMRRTLKSKDIHTYIHICLYIYIHIYPDGLIRGPIFCTPEGWYGAHFFQKISFPPQPEAKKQKIWVVENRADTEPQKQVQIRRAPCQPSFFWGSVSALQTLPTAERTIGAKLFENFQKTTRAPNQLFQFRRKNDISAGAAERRTFKSLPKVWHKLHPAFRRKNDFFSLWRQKSLRSRFSELSFKNRQSTTWANRANPGKTSAKRPQLTSPPPPPDTRVAHLDLSMYPPFFCCCFQPFYVWGGGGLCLFISRHRLFALICLVCCFWYCFLFVFFSFICFALGKQRRNNKRNVKCRNKETQQRRETKEERTDLVDVLVVWKEESKMNASERKKQESPKK